ncbi:MAG TPA: NAD(P)/FAD-dependent oxidoreductase [Patescibacteria group bacterium]|nr:NAD(P)/FAD-dependent oxidoreductase [Patescibacteria group bacterium]
MLRIANLRVALEDVAPLELLAARRLKLPVEAVEQTTIIRRAIDARRKHAIHFVYTLNVRVRSNEERVINRLRGDRDVSIFAPPVREPMVVGSQPLTDRPVVVGAGPSGLLAALTLAEQGYKPLLLERGQDVDTRTRDIADFWSTGRLNEASNVQFGEGGAGTFSDGKLTTRVNDPRMEQVLELLVEHGAPPEIRYLHKPHIGTDRLRAVVKSLRCRIQDLGGTVEFGARITDIEITGSQLSHITVNGDRKISCQVLLLAIGHSARDTYAMLHRRGLALEAKAFAIGVRIEHPQELIDQAQYGPAAGHPRLGAADYALVFQDRIGQRTAYSFCMCPGGQVVAAASEAGGLVTNGMSHYSRASGIANSAVVVGVQPSDWGGSDLGGVEFQRRWERLAFTLGGGDYTAPVQTVGDFLTGRSGGVSSLLSGSYRPEVKSADLHQTLPDYVTASLARALPDFGRRIRGFDHPGALMTGVETRTSSPVRLLRGNDFQSVSHEGIYPLGEGAGYAGGIMSAALDGLNGALAVISRYRPF